MKFKKLILLLVAFLLFLPTLIKAQDTNTCNEDLVTIESVTIEQKGPSVTQLSDPVINGKSITFNLKMNTVGEGIQYKIIINNASQEDFEFGNLNTSTNYISYTYTTDATGNIIKAGTIKTIFLAIQYENEVPDSAFTGGVFNDNKALVIDLATPTNTNPNTNTDPVPNTNTDPVPTNNQNVVNPKTGTEGTILFVIVFLFLACIGYIIFTKTKNIKHLVVLLGLTVLLPLTVYAACSCRINIESKITIEKSTTTPTTPTNPTTGATVNSLKNTVVTSGDGLYKVGNRYIYKGENPNNYITLGNAQYRIMAIEEDNTLKVIKATSIGTIPFDAGYTYEIADVTNERETIGTRYGSGSTDLCYTANNTSYTGCKVWSSKNSTQQIINNSLGTVTTFPKIHDANSYFNLPAYDSYVNVYLNGGVYNKRNGVEIPVTGWYATLDSETKSKIKTSQFYIGNVAYEANQTTQTDIAQEKEYIWTGKVGLMSISDYVQASSNTACTGVYSYEYTQACYNNSASHNYLTNNGNEWTLSPVSVSNYSKVWSIDTNHKPNSGTNAESSYNVRPVFYLDLTNVNLEGNGTSTTPFTF